jgi:hypothetical protein
MPYQGGTGVTTPGMSAGEGISVTGTWPNQTITNLGSVTPTITAGPNIVITGTWPTITISASGGATFPVTTSLFKGDGAGGIIAGSPNTDYSLPMPIGSAILKGNGTGGASPATANVDYAGLPNFTGSGISITGTYPNLLFSSSLSLPVTTAMLKGNNAGGAVAATAGTDFLLPAGNGSALTGLTFPQITGFLAANQNTTQTNLISGTSYTVVTTDRGKLLSFSSATPVAVTLPQPGASYPANWNASFQNRGSGAVTITPVSSQIDSSGTPIVLAQNSGITLVSDGNNYFSFRGSGTANAGTGDVISDVGTSTDGQIALYAGTTGKHIKTPAAFPSTVMLKSTTTGVLQAGVPNQDFAKATADKWSDTVLGSSGSPQIWPTSAIVMNEGSGLNNLSLDGFSNLPPANSFSAGTVISYVDSITFRNFGRNFKAAGTDTLDVGTPYFKPFVGGGVGPSNKKAQFVTDGISAWKYLRAGLVDHLESPANASVQGIFDLSAIPAPSPAGTPVASKMVWPAADFVGVIPADSGDSSQPVTGVGTDGNLHFTAINQVPDVGAHGAGEVLSIVSGGYDWAQLPSGGSGYQVLNGLPNPVVWNCVAGQRQQNAIVTLGGSRALLVNGAQSGYDFNLIVKQPAGGGATITALPSKSRVGNNGLGVFGIPPLTTTGGAVDWIKGSYVAQDLSSGVEWVWAMQAANLTLAPPPTCTLTGCPGGDACGTSAGASVLTQGQTGGASRQYFAMDFFADATSICKVDMNWQRVTDSVVANTPNYDLRAYIYTDASRKVFTTSASTGASSPVVSLNGTGIQATDIGQEVRFSAGSPSSGFPAGTYYVGAIDTVANTLTVSSSRTDPTNAANFVNSNATPANNITVTVMGIPGTLVGTSSTAVNTLNMQTLLTGTGSANDTPVSFTFTPATGPLTVGTHYWLVVGVDTSGGLVFGGSSWNATNYAAMLYQNIAGSPVQGFKLLQAASTTPAVWSATPNRKGRFVTWH